jgi:hypothetical protein
MELLFINEEIFDNNQDSVVAYDVTRNVHRIMRHMICMLSLGRGLAYLQHSCCRPINVHNGVPTVPQTTSIQLLRLATVWM